MHTVMIVECCSCGEVQRVKDGYGVSGPTSTLCVPCIERLYPEYTAEFNAIRARRQEERAAA